MPLPSKYFETVCPGSDGDSGTESEPDLSEEEDRTLPTWLDDDKLRSVVKASIGAELFEGPVISQPYAVCWLGKKQGTYYFGETDRDQTHRLDYHISIPRSVLHQPLERRPPPSTVFYLTHSSDTKHHVDLVLASVRTGNWAPAPVATADGSADRNVLDLSAVWMVEVTERKCECH